MCRRAELLFQTVTDAALNTWPDCGSSAATRSAAGVMLINPTTGLNAPQAMAFRGPTLQLIGSVRTKSSHSVEIPFSSAPRPAAEMQ